MHFDKEYKSISASMNYGIRLSSVSFPNLNFDSCTNFIREDNKIKRPSSSKPHHLLDQCISKVWMDTNLLRHLYVRSKGQIDNPDINFKKGIN